MRVVFSNRAYVAVMAETTEKIQTETGGLFLGAVERDTWYIIEAIDPGPKSVFEVAYFEYDQQYTQHLINKIANLYKEKLSLIGLWHRHPGSMDVFSTTDNGTNAKYASMRQCGAISALVNIDPTFRLTMYHVGKPCRYTKISYVIGDELIPNKYMELKMPQQFETIMQNILHPTQNSNEYHPTVSLRSFMNLIEPYFINRETKERVERHTASSEEVRNKIIDSLVTDLSFMSDEIGIELSVLQNAGLFALTQDTIDGMIKIFFVYDEKNDRLLFQYNKANYLYEDGLFENLYRSHISNEGNKMNNGDAVHEIQEDLEQETKKIINGVLRFIKIERDGDN